MSAFDDTERGRIQAALDAIKARLTQSSEPSRDQLAAMAMEGLLASGAKALPGQSLKEGTESIAFAAYEIAEAMLLERYRRNQADK